MDIANIIMTGMNILFSAVGGWTVGRWVGERAYEVYEFFTTSHTK